MKNFAWSVATFIIVVAISSGNSSTRHREVITYNPTAPLREEYTYVGGCYCIYDLDQRGNLCGKRSAWYRSGGAEPECYFGDRYGY